MEKAPSFNRHPEVPGSTSNAEGNNVSGERVPEKLPGAVEPLSLERLQGRWRILELMQEDHRLWREQWRSADIPEANNPQARTECLLHYEATPPEVARAKGWAVFFATVLLDTGLADHPAHAAMGEAILRRIADNAQKRLQ